MQATFRLKGDRHRVRLLAVTVLSLAGITPSAGQAASRKLVTGGPPLPYFDGGACPFEGCTYQDWGVDSTVKVYATRRANSVVAFTLRRGDRVQALGGVVVTVQAGLVQFKQAVDLDADGTTVHVEPRDTLFLLDYRGEGQTVAWFRGKFYRHLDGTEFFNGACELPGRNCNGTIIARPVTEWWIYIRNARGQEGWTMEFTKFNNMDALGG